MPLPVLLEKITTLYFSRPTQNMTLREKLQEPENKFLERRVGGTGWSATLSSLLWGNVLSLCRATNLPN